MRLDKKLLKTFSKYSALDKTNLGIALRHDVANDIKGFVKLLKKEFKANYVYEKRQIYDTIEKHTGNFKTQSGEEVNNG